jgi:CubicO group peptidase (beta-lactamase class C family)
LPAKVAKGWSSGALAGLALLIALALTALPAAAQNGAHAPLASADLERFVDGAVANGMMSDHIAGVSVAVVQDGKVLLLKGYGQAAPGRAVDPRRDIFRVASLSKTFTWIAVMREVERGRLKLDAPINDYLPPDLKIPDEGFSRPIRLIDLMSHSAGFEDSVLGHLIVARPDDITSLDRYLARHRPRRVREPGVLSSYSNYGAALAGYIAAQADGRDYQTLVEQDLFAPLGMTSSTFREPYPARSDLPAPIRADLRDRLASGFEWKDGGLRPCGFEYLTQDAPIGGASTTAADMSRYMLMVLAGGSVDGQAIYGPQTAAAFRTPILQAPPGANGWAHGWRVGVLPTGQLTYGHNGALQRFFSSITLVPELGLGIFVNTNTSTGGPITDRLPQLITARFYPGAGVAARRPGVPGLLKQASLYDGAYITTRRSYTGLEQFVDLMDGEDHVTVTPAGYLVTRVGHETRSWVPEGATGRFIAADGPEEIVFERRANGRALRFAMPSGGNSEERAPLLLNRTLFVASAVLALCMAGGMWIVRFGAGALAPAPRSWEGACDRLGLAASALWLLALAVFASSGWLGAARGPLSDPFPGVALLGASWAAVAASTGSAAFAGAFVVAALRETCAWSAWSKGPRALAAVSFLTFALVLGARGGLTPWLYSLVAV